MRQTPTARMLDRPARHASRRRTTLLCALSLAVVGAALVSVPGSPAAASSPVRQASPSSDPVVWSSLDTSGQEYFNGGACGVRVDRTLWCWGDNEAGQLGDGSVRIAVAPRQVGDQTDWADVAISPDHTCATRLSDTLWCWGRNNVGQLGTGDGDSSREPVQVGDETTWALVATAAGYSCGVKIDSTMWCWGSNSAGQLGDGTHINRSVPTRIGSNTSAWQTVSVGDGSRRFRSHACALRTDGSLWCWGSNAVGELGLGYRGASVLSPHQVGTDTDWRQVSAGSYSTCAVRADDTLWCWGDNLNGLLGDGTEQRRLKPTQIAAEQAWLEVTVGETHACAIADDGSAWCWGYGLQGQLGGGDEQDALIPQRVVDPGAWSQIRPAEFHTCGLTVEGAARCWGSSYDGQLGGGAFRSASRPVAVDGRERFVDPGYVELINGGSSSMCALTADGQAGCWGRLPSASGNYAHRPTKHRDWISMAGHQGHLCGVASDGALWCVGDNGKGQLGDGTTEDRRTMIQIGSARWQSVATGLWATCAIHEDGSLWCWGYNLNGQLGLGDTQDRLVPTKVADGPWSMVGTGDLYACAVTADGALWCWGDNVYGQLGDGTQDDRLSPVLVDDTRTWVTVEPSFSHSCAITADGSAWCWGSGSSGKLGDGTTDDHLRPNRVGSATDWTSIASTHGSTCGTRELSGAWCWGSDHDGVLGNGPGEEAELVPTRVRGPHLVQVSAQQRYVACGLTADGEAYCWGSNQEDAVGDGRATAQYVPTRVLTVRGVH